MCLYFVTFYNNINILNLFKNCSKCVVINHTRGTLFVSVSTYNQRETVRFAISTRHAAYNFPIVGHNSSEARPAKDSFA